jgi:biotin transport system substrate-specific component
MGISGLPVFAGPVAGPAYLLGPTGGYLVGFVAGAMIVGLIAGPGRHSLARLVIGTGLGSMAILACGAAWLATGMGQGVSVENALAIGVVPFLPGAIAKMMIVVGLAKLADGARIQIR